MCPAYHTNFASETLTLGLKFFRVPPLASHTSFFLGAGQSRSLAPNHLAAAGATKNAAPGSNNRYFQVPIRVHASPRAASSLRPLLQ
jgi:hypothetical protein